MSRTCRRPPVRPPRLSWSQSVPLHCVRSRRRVKDAVLDVSKRSKMRSRFCTWEDFTEALSSGTGNQCIVVLCGSQYAGNLGSAIRACALLGVKWVCVLDVLEWRFVQSAFRAAQLERPEHAEWNVHLVQAPAGRPQKEALVYLQDRFGFELMGLTDAPTALPLWNAKLDHKRLALIFGKESGGIPPEVESLLDVSVTVPQADKGCLNVSHAIAITAYERRRQEQVEVVEPCWSSEGEALKRRRLEASI